MIFKPASPFGHPSRRRLLGASLAIGLCASSVVRSGPREPLSFPKDHGAHPDFRTEWWYLTGYLHAGDAQPAFGFQVTFFRSRVAATQDMQSPWAAKHLVFAHAAVTDIRGQKLWHDQRIARSSGVNAQALSIDMATFSTDTTSVRLKNWSLQRSNERIQAQVEAQDFSMKLRCTVAQPLLLQGDQGLSRKGPQAAQSSFYYSQPQLNVEGEVELQKVRHAVTAPSKAWLDHEWSNELLHPQAVGWDWIGINLFDGAALTAFRLRTKEGTALWDGGSFRIGTQRFVFSRGEVEFKPVRTWRSPMSRATYPVEWIVRTPADFYTVRAVIDNQELDSRASTGAIYWEGLSDVWDSNGKHVGRGYLEMTGYADPIRV